jgi:surface antigen
MLSAVPAIAQFMPPIQRSWPGLTADDLDRLHTAELRLFEGHSIGAIERWRSPDTGDSGSVELVRKYDANGLPCRRVNYSIRLTAEATALNHYVLDWCRQQSGEWKIIPDRPPS